MGPLCLPKRHRKGIYSVSAMARNAEAVLKHWHTLGIERYSGQSIQLALFEIDVLPLEIEQQKVKHLIYPTYSNFGNWRYLLVFNLSSNRVDLWHFDNFIHHCDYIFQGLHEFKQCFIDYFPL
ncbi:hypothetical protein H106_01059 [Trichophyton rubrum CBS 735.88]|nr:hypothetical protein H106_01059 [Trichophyton rubrum CBS 735.88]